MLSRNKVENLLLVAIFLLTTFTPAYPQTAWKPEMLTVNDGLSQGMIYDILQSRDGFIWIATKDGLNRYDGSRFMVFSPNPFDPYAIGSSEIQSLFEDSRGWIWVSLPDGLDVLDPVSGRFFHIKHRGRSILANSFVETPDGCIWLSDKDQVWKISLQKDMLTEAVAEDRADIEPTCKAISISSVGSWSGVSLGANVLLLTRDQKLLVGTHQGVYRIDISTEKIIPELEIPGYFVLWMEESKSGEILIKGDLIKGSQLWVRVVGGNAEYVEDKLSAYPRSRFIFDDDGYFWAFRDRSLQKWRPASFFNKGKPEIQLNADELQLGSLHGNSGTTFMVDKSGIIWTGTNGYGLTKINENASKFNTVLAGYSHGLIMEDPKGGFYNSWFPDQKFLSKNFDRSIPDTTVQLILFQGQRDVAFDRDGNVWALKQSGRVLYRTEAASKSKKAFPFEGDGLLHDRNGNLISVNKKGLYRFDPITETSQYFPFENPQHRLSDNASHFLYEDSEGVLWIFGYTGLLKAVPSKSGYDIKQYLNNPDDRNSLSINIVLSVADDPLEPQRYLWVGTKGGGLNRLEKSTGKFKQFTQENGLPDNVVYGILAQERTQKNKSPGYIWMSTNKGICRFDVREETTRNFTVADGLQGNEFNSGSYLKTKDGSLIFGGVNGLNVFHPDSLHFNENEPQIHIVGLKVNNREMGLEKSVMPNLKSEIILSHDQNLLNFDFAALEFTNPAQNLYRYQLVGVDKGWVDLGNKNTIQFANLAPGKYTFKVQGSNNDGVWSTQPAQLHFTIRPPWWATWWACMLYLLLAASGIWVFYHIRLRQKLEHQETLRLREMDDFKSQFFTNITHEFRTPLTVILGMGEQLSKAETDPHKLGKLALIKRNGESLLRLINQILDLAKLESNSLKINYIQGDILTYLKYIAESLHSLANAQNVMLRVESSQPSIVMDYDPDRFLQIIHNLLSNGIKFTPSGGKVLLRAEVQDKWLHISVKDSGAGIPEDEMSQLFERFFQAKNQQHAKAGGTGIGLSLVSELVKAMGGDISVQSKVGAGSTFLVQLPVTNTSAITDIVPSLEREDWSTLAISASMKSTTDILNGEDSKPQILLIEDNPDVVEYLTACLEKQFRLEYAYNGMAGVENALTSVPDLIISDVMMPIKDGFEVLEILKNDACTSHIPIILLTAKADVQSRLSGLRRGADAYLSKPFNQEELLVTVANLIESRQKLKLKYQQNILAPTNPEVTSEDPENSFLQNVRSIIDANYHQEDFGLPQLCQKIGMSRSQLFRKIKALTDLAPSELLRTHRLRKAKILLQTGTVNVAEAAWQVGFKDPSYFSKIYQEEFGEPPSATRK